MTDQGSLFDPTLPIARNTDPATSHEAGSNVTASGARQTHAERVLEIVYYYPGKTHAEIAALTQEHPGKSLRDSQVWKRLSDLRNRGLIVAGEPRECTVNKTNQTTWTKV